MPSNTPRSQIAVTGNVKNLTRICYVDHMVWNAALFNEGGLSRSDI
jgi:hypothetical protein